MAILRNKVLLAGTQPIGVDIGMTTWPWGRYVTLWPGIRQPVGEGYPDNRMAGRLGRLYPASQAGPAGGRS